MSERAVLQSSLFSFSVPLLAGATGWLGTQVAGLLFFVKALAAGALGPDIGEFVARPYVFPPLCMLLAAFVQAGVKVFVSYTDNQLRRDRDALRAEIAALRK